jgi:uncharacterized protein YndB with AHSA1/START domain
MATLSIESAPTSNDLMLSQTRVIRSPRSRVYEAWINPAILAKWFGSATTHCAGATIDARPGGKYRIEVAPNTPPPAAAGQATSGSVAVVGHFTKIVPNELVQFTWSADWSPDEESLVTVSLKDVAEGTELTLVQERFSTEISRDNHNNGWTGGLDKFVKLLEA